MIIEASHYDTVEWTPRPMKPGEMFYRPKASRPITITDTRLKLRAPCRVDVGLLDYSALKFTDDHDYKAGEISFAGDLYTWVSVKLINKPDILIQSERPLIVEHYTRIMKEITEYGGGFEIETGSHQYRHVGFGSSAVMAETLVTAINTLLGEPFKYRDLRELVAKNFLEESDSTELLFPGASTGGSFNTVRSGGMVITSAESEEIFHVETPEEYTFVIGTPDVKTAGPESSETDVNCMGWERHNERINAAKSCLWILTEVMPYAVRGDWNKVGAAFYNYTLFGGKAMQMLYYQASLADILFQMKVAKIEGGWMTSAGPSLVAFTKDKVDVAKEIFEKHNFKQILEVHPDNRGIQYV
jgi:predicted sugar kinase